MKSAPVVHKKDALTSHPARGAWIEIAKAKVFSLVADVAPRKGCVD